MQQINISIDETLIKEGLKETGLKTKKDLIDFALRELLRRKNLKKLLQLKGTIHWEGDLKQMRQRRNLS